MFSSEFCPRCHLTLNQGAMTCPHCGAPTPLALRNPHHDAYQFTALIGTAVMGGFKLLGTYVNRWEDHAGRVRLMQQAVKHEDWVEVLSQADSYPVNRDKFKMPETLQTLYFFYLGIAQHNLDRQKEAVFSLAIACEGFTSATPNRELHSVARVFHAQACLKAWKAGGDEEYKDIGLRSIDTAMNLDPTTNPLLRQIRSALRGEVPQASPIVKPSNTAPAYAPQSNYRPETRRPSDTSFNTKPQVVLQPYVIQQVYADPKPEQGRIWSRVWSNIEDALWQLAEIASVTACAGAGIVWVVWMLGMVFSPQGLFGNHPEFWSVQILLGINCLLATLAGRLIGREPLWDHDKNLITAIFKYLIEGILLGVIATVFIFLLAALVVGLFVPEDARKAVWDWMLSLLAMFGLGPSRSPTP